MTGPDRPDGLTYRDAGVDIDAGNALVDRIRPLAAATRRAGTMDALGGFGALFDLKAAGFADPILVAATDGVGTKLRLALDAGDLSGVGADLVAMCVNDLICQGAEPLFFLDYFATGRLDLEAAETVIAGVARACAEAGCALIGGETAEMPGLYAEGDLDLAGFAVGAMERGGALPRPARPGDVLLALPSTGVHSNGFSLVRRIVERAGADLAAPAPFEAARSLAAALLTPTALYPAPARAARAAAGEGLRALAHVTGGGLPENLPRALPEGLGAALDPWPLPPVFRWLAETGGVAEAEMLRVFNCGVGLVLVLAPEVEDAVRDALPEAFRLGVVTETPGVALSLPLA